MRGLTRVTMPPSVREGHVSKVAIGRSSATCYGSSDMQLDMAYIWCPENCKYVARLSTLFILLQNATGLSDHLEASTV